MIHEKLCCFFSNLPYKGSKRGLYVPSTTDEKTTVKSKGLTRVFLSEPATTRIRIKFKNLI